MAEHPLDPGADPDDGFVIQPTETVRAGRQRRSKAEPPDTLSARLTAKAQLLSDRLFERRRELAKSAGLDEPLKGNQLSPTEKKTQYKELIASREMLFNSIAGAAIVGRSGELRISTKMVDAFRELSDAS